MIAILFTLPIYLAYFDINNKIIITISVIASFYFLLTSDKLRFFLIGFLVGLMWFYWISYSFIYYDLKYLMLLMTLFVAISYGLLFLVMGFIQNIFLRIPYFIALEYIHPFGFNWFNPKILLVHSYFSIQTIHYLGFLLAIAMFVFLKNNLRYIALLPLLLSFEYQSPTYTLPTLNIQMVNTNINQDEKWSKENIYKNIDIYLHDIQTAIDNQKDMIIFPESAFAIYLNKDQELLDLLKEYSMSITIITGGLKISNGQIYNSTYVFDANTYKVIDKVILVPFGEKIPLPKPLVDLINKIFFDGAQDYTTAQKFEDFEIKGIKFRNAICYEATREEAYEKNPQYMIAISNNAWFTPSIQPTIQYLLIKYYAKKYNTVVYHTTNKDKTAIITP